MWNTAADSDRTSSDKDFWAVKAFKSKKEKKD